MIRVITIALMLALFTPEIIAQKRPLRIGAITDNAPISFVNENGVTVGFSIDITRVLMQRLDADYTIELFDYKTALNRLDSGKIDLLCSLGESYIKLNKYHLSTPYITLDIDIITRKGENLVNLNDIADKKIITDSAHSYHDKLIATGKDLSSNIILVDNTRKGLNMLSKGEGDCAITVTQIAQSILQHEGLSNLKVQNSDLDGVKICFASTDRTLIRNINKKIVDIKQSGTFEEIRYDWFGTEKQAYPISYIYYGLAIALILIAASTTFVLVLRNKIKQGVQESTSKISELQKNIKIALNTGGIALWKYNLQEQKFITIEGETLAGTGLTMDENLNLLHPDDRENQKAILAELISGERSQASATFRCIAENGDYRTYESTMSVVNNHQGKIVGILGSQRDITEQTALIEETRTAKEYGKKLYSDLNNNTKLLTTVLEEMPLGLFIKDIKDNFRYLFASNFFCDKVVQKSSVEIIKHTDYDIFPMEAAEKFRKDDLAIVNSGSDEVQYIGKEHLNVKGKEFVVETFKLILKLPNDVTLLIGYCTDITENEKINISLQESKERAEESDKLKSAFLANMSHEIRTPLNAIVGFSDLLIVSDDQEDREEFGKIITNNNKLLLNLINDILDISKIEAGSFTFINELFDVNELCTEMNSIFGMQVKQNVELIYIPAKEVVNILFDKNRFRQILNNFLSNAVKFTPAGRIEFGYELIDGGIKMVVKDTGIGISVEDHKKVFGRFAKFDDFAQGTGLGLAICKALVELRGGKIGFESTQNVGSTFWFWIPCQFETVDILKRIEAIGTIKRDKNKQNFRILIAEDIDSNYMLIGAILKEYELTRATDGKQAIELCQSNKYDLVFMDIKMPNVTGLEATRTIRQFDTTTPIIALTANAFDSDKTAAKEAGCNDFTAKPVSKQHILNIINKWLGQ